MHHRPSILRLAAAFLLALGLLGAIVTPSLAQDATPIPEDGPTGTLQLLYFLCNGDAGLKFIVGNPGESIPTPDDCVQATTETDTTFVVYLFGDMNSTPVEVPTVNGVGSATVPVTDSTPHRIQLKLPDGSLEDPASVEFWANFDIEADTETAVDAQQFQTGTVELYKVRCAGDPAESRIDVFNPGDQFDSTPYEGCSPDDRAFTITPFGDDVKYGTISAATVNGTITVEDVPTTTVTSGPHKIVEDGTELLANFEVAAAQTTVIVAVNLETPTGDLTITKVTCQGDGLTEFFIDQLPPEETVADCVPADESFSIYPNGDKNADPITASTGAQGSVDVSDLPVTTDADPHILVEDSTGAETPFDVQDGATTVVNVVNFVPESPADGVVEIEKLACTGIDEPAIHIGNPGDDSASIPDNCFGSSAEFLIYLYGDEDSEPVSLTIDGFDSVQLPPTDGTPHKLVELDGSGDPVASALFEIESDNVTSIQVRNPTYGDVMINSYLCVGDDDSRIDVYAPGEAADLPSDCEPMERNFTITTFGEGGSPGSSFVVSTDWDGVASVTGLPATDSVGHLIATSGGVDAIFEIAPDEETAIVSLTYEPEETDDSGDAVDDTSDSENVDEMPDTGTGSIAPQGDGSALLVSLASVIAIAGLSVFMRRRAA